MGKNKRSKKTSEGAPMDSVSIESILPTEAETEELQPGLQEELDDALPENNVVSEDNTEVTPVEGEKIQDAPTPGVKVRKIKDVMFDCLVTEQITDTQEVLNRIYAEFPTANSGPKDVSWYRWKFREAGHPIPGGRGAKLSEDEKKAKKAAYESTRKQKLAQDKEARRQEAQQKLLEQQQADIAALTDRAMELCEERGLPINGENIKTILAELRAPAAV